MKFTTKLLSGAALAIALMNTAVASTVDWSFAGSSDTYGPASGTFTYDSVTNTFSNVLVTYPLFSITNYPAIFTLVDTNLSATIGSFTLGFTPSTAMDFGSAENLISGDITYFDNAVMSVTFTSVGSTATAVPEPEAYAMMLAGLGLVGFAARRKQAV